MTWKGFAFAYLPHEPAAVPAGTLTLLEQGTEPISSEFGYGKGYLARSNSVPVDPYSLPLEALPGDRARYEPPAGLPLFGAVRDAAPDYWGRRVIENRLQVPPHSLPESRYLLEAGSERFGALDFRDSRDAAALDGALPPVADLRYLLEAADRVQAGAPVPAQLQALFAAGTLGGARPKALVLKEGRQHVAKFSLVSDPFEVPTIERACLELARQCGLNVPPTDLVTLPNGRTVMLIERFDRLLDERGHTSRVHCVSALTLLGRHESDSPTSHYREIAEAISSFGVDGAVHADRKELFGRVAFNILVNNNDDHLRNHAFTWDGDAKGWRLSPLYDVVPAPQLARERHLHLSVGPRGRLATLDNLLDSHGAYGLLVRDAARLIDHVAGRVREWRTRFEAMGVGAAQCDAVASAFRRPLDIGLDVVQRHLR